jgi:phosphoribosylglycinamide formyltransferase 2
MFFRICSIFVFSISVALANQIGTPLTPSATRVVLCGAGELGKELTIELQRFGVEVVAIDRYANAPAMQLAHRSHVINIRDQELLYETIKKENPSLIVPELESIATEALLRLEQEGFRVIPNARAAHVTMNRERIRRLAAEKLGLKTSPYIFADTKQELEEAVKQLGLPCVIKPVISSSGKGQSIIRSQDQIEVAWEYAQTGGRGASGRVIVEGFIDFDYEITLLTVRHEQGTSFCRPIGHLQIDGDYRESWQPHPMAETVEKEARRIARAITDCLGGLGIFGVELFIKGNEVFFSEVSPRPHDTGMVTLTSQNLSEFALHARAILGLPIPEIVCYGPSASCAFLVHGASSSICYKNLTEALRAPYTDLRLFGKPEVKGSRRMGVALARDSTIEAARNKARNVVEKIEVLQTFSEATQ